MCKCDKERDRKIGQLYRDHAAALRKLISRRFGAGPPEPEDVVQTAFVQLASHPDLAKIENPPAFLYRTAFNLVLQHRRHGLVVAGKLNEVTALYGDAAGGVDCPARILEGRQGLKLVSTTIDELPATQRDALLLRSIDELSYDDIGRRIGLSPSRALQLRDMALRSCKRAVTLA